MAESRHLFAGTLVRIDPDKALFPISTAAEILGCPQKVLRLYERNGLLTPARTDGKRRLYSQRDIERLEFIHYLTHVKRVNVAGVKMILELLPHIEAETWESILRGVEETVGALSGDERRVFQEGSADVVAALEADEG